MKRISRVLEKWEEKRSFGAWWYMDKSLGHALDMSSALSAKVHSWSLSNLLMTGAKATLPFTDSVAIGIQKGMEECRVQFTWERWNCPTQAFVRTRYLPANRETAFVLAMTTAGVMHTLTRNCTMGNFENCGCDNSKLRSIGGKDWKWGGCSENIYFGMDVTRDLLESRESGKDARALVNLHNNQAGRVAVVKTMQRLCKCQGVSGSCSVQTCWMKLGDLRSAGNFLKQQYEKSIRVDYENGILRVGEAMTRRHPELSDTNLVYLEESPNYCMTNSTADVHGTQGRECSRQKGPSVSRSEKNSCRNLCRKCGLRVRKMVAQVVSSCNCKFVWCCDVHCEQCRKRVKKYTCYQDLK